MKLCEILRLYELMAAITALACGSLSMVAADVKAPNLVNVVTPKFKEFQMVLSHLDAGKQSYLSNPCLLRVADNEIIFTFKRGSSHNLDYEADCDVIRFDITKNCIIEHRTLGHLPGRRFQLTLPMLMRTGEIRFYADLQSQGPDSWHYRTGIGFASSVDGGRTVAAWRDLGLVDGIEYGYPLDFIVENRSIFMLAMSFGYRPGGVWSVGILESTDGAVTWRLRKDVTAALGGAQFNESSFVRDGGDFLVICRGYDAQATKIARFDSNFELIGSKTLTGQGGALYSYVGWPRLFLKDDQLYLLGRVWTSPLAWRVRDRPTRLPRIADNQQLGLVRINRQTLELEQVAVLDNDEGNLVVVDGYYAAPYWTTVDGHERFNLISYRAVGLNNPDLIRLSYRWAEVR